MTLGWEERTYRGIGSHNYENRDTSNRPPTSRKTSKADESEAKRSEHLWGCWCILESKSQGTSSSDVQGQDEKGTPAPEENEFTWPFCSVKPLSSLDGAHPLWGRVFLPQFIDSKASLYCFTSSLGIPSSNWHPQPVIMGTICIYSQLNTNSYYVWLSDMTIWIPVFSSPQLWDTWLTPCS